MMEIVSGLFLIAGSFLMMLAGVGVIRFPDVYSRMHAAAKAPVLGVMLIGIGVVFARPSWSTAIIIGLVVVLQMIASPVGSHMIARSVYLRVRPEFDDVDELAQRRDTDE